MRIEIPALKQIVEGAILAADQPLNIDQMISLFEKDQPSRANVREILKEIEQDCEGRGFELKQVASGYRFQVRQDYGEWVGRLWEERPPRYSRALLETLALIAYKQPITRGDIEEIRGVAVSTNIMRSLLEREWVRVVGHRDVPGRPAIYATTRIFLDYFNLSNLEELPTLSDIKDLDKANEELNLEEEIFEIRSLELEAGEQIDTSGIEDEDLEKVTEHVNAIQDNIRNLFAADAEDEEPEEDEELEEDDGDVDLHVKTDVKTDVESDVKRDVKEEASTNIHSLAGAVPQDILNAAFAEEDEDPSDAEEGVMDPEEDK
jgi:segregation and condensation protein B